MLTTVTMRAVNAITTFLFVMASEQRQGAKSDIL
jgi:hypothetical protein